MAVLCAEVEYAVMCICTENAKKNTGKMHSHGESTFVIGNLSHEMEW